MIETLDDILIELADRSGVYGTHGNREDGECDGDNGGLQLSLCRMCFEEQLKTRILKAVRVELKLGRLISA